MIATPPWIYGDAWRDLAPPAIVMKLGELPRSPDKLLSAARALFVTTARRYQTDASGTKCNIYLADVLNILAAPIPHRFNLGDGRGLIELRANDIVDGLRASKFQGWYRVRSVPAWVEASHGLPTVAVWKNDLPIFNADGKPAHDEWGRPRHHAGHVVLVVPTPPTKAGIYVTGAGARCIDQCPIAEAFGPYLPAVEFYSHE